MSQCSDQNDIFVYVLNVFIGIAITVYFLPCKKITLYVVFQASYPSIQVSDRTVSSLEEYTLLVFTFIFSWRVAGLCQWRILFSNHSRWGFFNQFGEFSSLAKFVGGSQEVGSPFGSAARYVRTCRIHSL